MVAEWKQGALALHALEASSKLDFGRGEAMASVQGTVHVGKGEVTEPLGVLCMQLVGGGGVEGHVLNRGRIGLEDVGVGPFLLVLLFLLDQGISLLRVLDLERVCAAALGVQHAQGGRDDAVRKLLGGWDFSHVGGRWMASCAEEKVSVSAAARGKVGCLVGGAMTQGAGRTHGSGLPSRLSQLSIRRPYVRALS